MAVTTKYSVLRDVEIGEGTVVAMAAVKEKIEQHFEEFSSKGFRILGIAYKDMESVSRISKDLEADMIFLGFLVLFDPPKPRIMETITSLKNLGVSLKVITGDNCLIAANISQQMGLANTKILSGPELGQMSDEALLKHVMDTDVFAEVICATDLKKRTGRLRPWVIGPASRRILDDPAG